MSPIGILTNQLVEHIPAETVVQSTLGDAAWTAYWSDPNDANRNVLVERYFPLVKKIAFYLATKLTPNVETVDLTSCGLFGLLDAIEKYDAQRGIKFETYAFRRIRGAMVDELRVQDWVPRSIRLKMREIEKVQSKLEHKLSRPPTSIELAEELGVELKELDHTLRSCMGVTSIEDWVVAQPNGAPIQIKDTAFIPKSSDDPVQSYELVEMKQTLAKKIDKLHERERLVLSLYYYEDLTLAEIGAIMGVTESRICQLHLTALNRLRILMSGQ